MAACPPPTTGPVRASVPARRRPAHRARRGRGEVPRAPVRVARSLAAASAWCARRRWAAEAPWYTADRISGWRKAIGATASAARRSRPGRPRRCPGHGRRRPATAGPDRRRDRRRPTAAGPACLRAGLVPAVGTGGWSRLPTGSGSGSSVPPDRWPSVSSPGSSMRASGLPRVSATRRAATPSSSRPRSPRRARPGVRSGRPGSHSSVSPPAAAASRRVHDREQQGDPSA